MENTKKSFGEIWAELTFEQREYLKGYINSQRQDAVKHYQAEQLRLHNVVGQSEQLACKCEIPDPYTQMPYKCFRCHGKIELS